MQEYRYDTIKEAVVLSRWKNLSWLEHRFGKLWFMDFDLGSKPVHDSLLALVTAQIVWSLMIFFTGFGLRPDFGIVKCCLFSSGIAFVGVAIFGGCLYIQIKKLVQIGILVPSGRADKFDDSIFYSMQNIIIDCNSK